MSSDTVSPTVAGGAGAAAPVCSIDQYDVIGVIGKGSFGTVSRIRRKADGRIMVWKELNYGTMREKEKQLVVSEVRVTPGQRLLLPRAATSRARKRRAPPKPRPSPPPPAPRARIPQVNILRELRHPHIVRYYDRIIDKAATKLYIVMEYCEGGDLGAMAKKAKRDGTAIEEDFVWKVLAQITVALKECHRHKEAAPAGGGGAPGKLKPILHRDLKPGNIFLDGQQNVKVRWPGASVPASATPLTFSPPPPPASHCAARADWRLWAGKGARVRVQVCVHQRGHALLHVPRDDQRDAIQ